MQDLPHKIAYLVVGRVRDHPRQVLVHRADCRPDGHVVVVQHDDEVALCVARVVECFIRQAARHGAVADHGQHVEVLLEHVTPHGNAPSRRDRGSRVSSSEGVVLRLVAPQERGEATPCADRRKTFIATCQHLVDVRLMAGVPDDLVARGVVDVVQRHRELRHPQARPEMATLLRQHVDVAGAQLVDQPVELVSAQAPEILRVFDMIQ